MTRLLTRLMLLILALAPGTACNAHQDAASRLRESATAYYDGLRWKSYERAALALPPEQRLSFVRRREAERDTFSVVDYEVRNVQLDPEQERASIEIDYTWHRLPSMRIQKSRMRQRWLRAGDNWFLVGQEEVKLPASEEAPEGTDLL